MKIWVLICGLCVSMMAQAQTPKVGMIAMKGEHPLVTPLERHVDSTWNAFASPGEDAFGAILAKRETVAGYIRETGETAFVKMFNGVRALHAAAAFLKQHPDYRVKDKNDWKALREGVDLRSAEILKCPSLPRVIADYYALKFIEEGCPVKEAWGAMRYNLIEETIDSPWDYRCFKEVLELNHPALSTRYLSCLPRVFQFNGCTEGLQELRPTFEKYMPEGKLKEEILAMYESYQPVRPGQMTPSFRLTGFDGKEYALEDFRGKVLVVDVWATWCGGCIERLPKFMKLREEYKNREDIVFITISIDRIDFLKTWKEKVVKLGLTDAINLLAPETTSFSKDFQIKGIPRYFVIDREGRIVSLFVPTTGPMFQEIIENTLNHK